MVSFLGFFGELISVGQYSNASFLVLKPPLVLHIGVAFMPSRNFQPTTTLAVHVLPRLKAVPDPLGRVLGLCGLGVGLTETPQ